MRPITTLAIPALFLTACTAPTGGGATGDETPDRTYTRDEARAASGKSDHGFDICEWMDWYGDGICDEFCVDPDPDCEAACRSDLDCPQPLCLPGGPCPTFVCVEGECVYDDARDSCPAGERECPGCHPSDTLCVPWGTSCPLLGCPPPPQCGGLAGLTCPEGMFCDWADESCGYADQLGTCTPIPDAWIEIYAPVCGCDGNTYGNEGEAHGNGVDVAYEGPCAEPAGRCLVGGCSGQVCYDEADGTPFTTCEWRPEYACYDTAVCERQPDGECGWTPTPELTMCLGSH